MHTFETLQHRMILVCAMYEIMQNSAAGLACCTSKVQIACACDNCQAYMHECSCARPLRGVFKWVTPFAIEVSFQSSQVLCKLSAFTIPLYGVYCFSQQES